MLEVIVGPMFSGKTERLLRLLAAAEARGLRVVAVKPAVDSRHGDDIVSHSGSRRSARLAATSAELLELAAGADLLGVEEGQFFDGDLPRVLRNRGLRADVVVAGLDRDFRARAFGPMAALAAAADVVTRLTAVCTRCGGRATLTQRLVDGVPARLEDDQVRIGGAELYEPRCRACYDAERAAVPATAADRLSIRRGS
jgi:thymidine kinase